MFAALTHEIKSLLHNTLGCLELAAQKFTSMPQGKNEFIKNAQHSGDMLLSLIFNVLDLTKLEVGQLEFNNEKTEYRKLLWNVIKSFKGLSVRKGITLQMYNEASIPKYLCMDTIKLSQLFMNFLGNAI